MIMLFVKALDAENQIRDFFCQIYELETGLGALSAIAVRGNKLIDAYIIEEGNKTRLPIQAFDSQDLIVPIQQLRSEWETILA